MVILCWLSIGKALDIALILINYFVYTYIILCLMNEIKRREGALFESLSVITWILFDTLKYFMIYIIIICINSTTSANFLFLCSANFPCPLSQQRLWLKLKEHFKNSGNFTKKTQSSNCTNLFIISKTSYIERRK